MNQKITFSAFRGLFCLVEKKTKNKMEGDAEETQRICLRSRWTVFMWDNTAVSNFTCHYPHKQKSLFNQHFHHRMLLLVQKKQNNPELMIGKDCCFIRLETRAHSLHIPEFRDVSVQSCGFIAGSDLYLQPLCCLMFV